MDDGNWRKAFVFGALERAAVEKRLQRREQLLMEIGGSVTYDGILKAAIARAKAAARGSRSYDLYGTWHQHIGTISSVWDKFSKILNEPDLQISESQKVLLMNQINQDYGTGASLYFE